MNWIRSICVVMSVVLMFAAGAQGQCDTYWMYTYDCDVMPNVSGAIEKIGGGTGSFFLSNPDPAAVYLNGDGTLTINDLVTSGNHYCTVDVASGMWSQPATIEVKMSMNEHFSTSNNNVPLRVSNGSNSWEWWIYETYLFGARTVNMDMTQMRVMRISLDETGGTLYIDNGGTIEAIGGYVRSTTNNNFTWGDTYSNETADMTWDYIYWLTGDAYDFDQDICKIGPTDCGYWGFLDEDLDKNCEVGIEDLAIMMGEWLTCTDPGGEGCVHAN